jgi:phosphoglycolate phosphatase
MKKKLVIFDLDGTLLNTASNLRYCVNQALKKHNKRQISLSQTIAYVGNGAKKLVERATADESLTESVYKDFMPILQSNLTHLIKPYPHVKRLLKRLKKEGVKIAVFSNKPHDATVAICNEFFATYAFDYVLGHKNGAPLKPDASGVFEILNALNVAKEDCLFIGDGETDAQTSINAGVDFIGVLWGFRSELILRNYGATCFASTPQEILNQLF